MPCKICLLFDFEIAWWLGNLRLYSWHTTWCLRCKSYDGWWDGRPTSSASTAFCISSRAPWRSNSDKGSDDPARPESSTTLCLLMRCIPVLFFLFGDNKSTRYTVLIQPVQTPDSVITPESTLARRVTYCIENPIGIGIRSDKPRSTCKTDTAVDLNTQTQTTT